MFQIDRLPFFPFYVSDYLSSMKVQLMSLAERGLYCDLLFWIWQEGPLPYNPDTQADKLARLTHCNVEEFRTLWPSIRERFVIVDGRITNHRLEEVRQEAVELHDKRAAAGRKGGHAKARYRSEKQPVENPGPARNLLDVCQKQNPSKTLATTPHHTTLQKQTTQRRVFLFWNSHSVLTTHRTLTPSMDSSIQARLKGGHTEEDLTQAIRRYAEMVEAGVAPGHNNWGLLELMKIKEGVWIDRMLDPNYRGIGGRRLPKKQREETGGEDDGDTWAAYYGRKVLKLLEHWPEDQRADVIARASTVRDNDTNKMKFLTLEAVEGCQDGSWLNIVYKNLTKEKKGATP